MDSNHLQPTTTSFVGYQMPSPFPTAVDDHRERAGAQLIDILPSSETPDDVATANVWGLNVNPWGNGSSTPMPSEKAHGKRRARTPDLESLPPVGTHGIPEDPLPNPDGVERRPPMVGLKRARLPGVVDTRREKKAKTGDKHLRKRPRSRGPVKTQRLGGLSCAPPSTEVLQQFMSGPSSTVDGPCRQYDSTVLGADHERPHRYEIAIPDGPLSTTFAFASPTALQNDSGPACTECKDLGGGLRVLLSAVEEMGKELHHLRDEMRVVKTSFTGPQDSQVTAHHCAAVAGEDVEMRPATAQPDEGPNEQQGWGAGSSASMTTPVVASTAEGEVNVHVARGRKVFFMLL